MIHYSSSTISCGTGFLFAEFPCDSSNSLRTSEPSSSLLSYTGCPEYSGGVCCLLAAFRLLKKRSIIAARMRRPPIAAPTPIPACAHVDRSVFVIAAELGDEVADAVVSVLALEGEAAGEVAELEEVVLAGRSCWRCSTHIGCAHIVSGPATVVVLGAVLLARACTAVEPEAFGYELMHPS